MTAAFTESFVEQAALAWLESAGWQIRSGAEIAPGEPAAERDDYGQLALAQRLRDALARLNPALPAEALDEAFRKLTRPEGAELIVRNRALHSLLVDGVTVEYRDAEGSIRGAQARVIDFDDPASNDRLAVNQFSVAEALRIRDDVTFFQAVQAVLAKRAPGDARPEEDLDHAVRQIISRAVAPEGVIDIFAAAGLAKPDISILSAVELLQKLLKGELATRRRKNVVQARSFAEMIEQTIRCYQTRAIEAAQVIEELIALAEEMREASARGESLRLSEDELAFYDALEANDSAVKVLGDETLRTIAQELVRTVRANVMIDWTLRENVRAQLRVLVKRILRRYGYPPDKQEKATETVLEQAALLSAEWAAA